MASRVLVSVSVTPIYTATNAEMNDTDVVAKDVGKIVGGTGSTTVTWGSTTGYSAGAPVYESTGNYISTTSAKFVFIKHTGFTYNSSSELGVVTNATLTITIGDTGLDESVLAVLNPGQAIALPYAIAKSVAFGLTASSGTIAVEYFWTV